MCFRVSSTWSVWYLIDKKYNELDSCLLYFTIFIRKLVVLIFCHYQKTRLLATFYNFYATFFFFKTVALRPHITQHIRAIWTGYMHFNPNYATSTMPLLKAFHAKTNIYIVARNTIYQNNNLAKSSRPAIKIVIKITTHTTN